MPEIKIIPARDKSGDILRVAAYARVSSDSEDQLNSYSAQIRYYTEMLSNSTDSVFVDMYADEGITGTSKDKRDDFNRLISDCHKGKIDRILAKSVSRFARNTVDSLQTVRELKALGISVYFEKENIDTAELSSEMLLAVYSQIAQEESMSISKNCRMGAHKRMADGTYINNYVPYGYMYVNRETVIDNKRAAIVRQIFDRFLKGDGVRKIANALNRQKAPTPHNSAKWHHTAIMCILRNEKYIGDSLFQKHITSDTLPFVKTRNKGEKPQFYAECTHKAIITKEIFEAAQKLIEQRKITPESKTYREYPLSKIIYCGRCGTMYRRKYYNNKKCWVCRNHDELASNCPSKRIGEETFYRAYINMFNKMVYNYKSILPQMIRQLQELADRQITGNAQISAIKKEIADIKDQAHLTAKLKSQGILDEAYYTAKIKELDNNLMSLQKQLRAMADNDEETRQISELKQLMATFESAEPLIEFDEMLFAQTVERITVISETEICFRLIGGLVLTEVLSRKGR